MLLKTITSEDNPLIKKITKILNGGAKRLGVMQAVIYGEHLLQEALHYGILDSVLICNDCESKFQQLVETFGTDRVYMVNHKIINGFKLAESKVAIIGLINCPNPTSLEAVYSEDCIVLDKIQDPGNLGAIFRLGAACGIKNVILSKGCVDSYNIKVLRASQGCQFALNIYDDIDLLEFVKAYHGLVVATTPRSNISIYDIDLSMPMAWIFGNEGNGVSKEVIATVKEQVSIPLAGNIESLNVAMAAGVSLFEMLRQRRTT